MFGTVSTWRKGQSGNPAGRKAGARCKAALALDGVGIKNAAEIIKKTTDPALAGDMRTAELILSRCWPARCGRPVELPKMPEIKSVADLPAAMAVLTAAVASGDLSFEEGSAEPRLR